MWMSEISNFSLISTILQIFKYIMFYPKLTTGFGFGFLYFWQALQLLLMFLIISNNCSSFILASFNRIIILSLEGWLNWQCILIAIFRFSSIDSFFTSYQDYIDSLLKLRHDCHLLFFLLECSNDLMRKRTLLLFL